MTGFSSTLFVERWQQFSLMEQMGNIGSEVDRAITWRQKGNALLASKALDRAIELLDFTIADPRWRTRGLKELTRVREILCDVFMGDNVYNTPPEFLSKYFYSFAVAARRNNGK